MSTKIEPAEIYALFEALRAKLTQQGEATKALLQEIKSLKADRPETVESEAIRQLTETMRGAVDKEDMKAIAAQMEELRETLRKPVKHTLDFSKGSVM